MAQNIFKGLGGPNYEQGVKTLSPGELTNFGWTHEVKHTGTGHDRILIKRMGNIWILSKIHI